MADDHGDDYFIPLVDQRVFGAGIKRKRIAFVPASSDVSALSKKSTETSSAGDRYLSIVLGVSADNSSRAEGAASASLSANELNASNCPICGQPLLVVGGDDSSHDTSIAHQVCLEHSHPPSHLDRTRTGLRYLQGCGWDPDARKGLGAQQEGIRIPIKARQKNDTSGVGATPKDGGDEDQVKQKKKQKQNQEEIVKLNAKEVKKMEIENSKRAEKLRQSFYGEDLTTYLGPNG